MSRLLGVLILCALSLALTGCALLNNTPLEGVSNNLSALTENPKTFFGRESPEKELRLFISAIQHGDYSRAGTYFSAGTTSEYKENPDKLASIPIGKDIQIIKQVTLANSAEIIVATGKQERLDAQFVLEKGRWKIKYFFPVDHDD
ncbi:MAG TPA: hypothetical protein VHQ46_06385 [Desulfobacteria bacterium]|nr:hypothetical protein [Desulfobacteria bacterium]